MYKAHGPFGGDNMPYDGKKWNQGMGKDIKGVSEVIGTILLVATSVVLVSVIGIYITSFPAPSPSKQTSMEASFDPDTRGIVVEHTGGKSIALANLRISLYDTNGVKVSDLDVTKDGTFTGNGDGYWDVGEKWNYTLPESYTANSIYVEVFDTGESLTILYQSLTITEKKMGLVPDLEVRGNSIAPDIPNPDELDTVNITIKIYNVGTATVHSGFSVNVYDKFSTKTKLITSKTLTPGVGGFAPNEFMLTYATWTPSALNTPCVGQHEVMVEVSQVSGEMDISNNAASKFIQVIPHVVVEVREEPDLGIAEANIDIVPSYPTHGDEVTISALIINYGGTAATADIVFYDGYLALDDSGDPVPPIPPVIATKSGQYISSSLTVSASWTTTSGGLHNITVSIENVVSDDPAKPELVKSNNYASTNLYVKPTILLVGDDNSTLQGTITDSVSRLRDAISAVGFTYDYYYVAPGTQGPRYDFGLNPLQDYDIVIWTCGFDAYGSLQYADVDNLTRYLDNGGNLWLIGTDIIEDLRDGTPSNGPVFLSDYLGIGAVSDPNVEIDDVTWTNASIINLSRVVGFGTIVPPSPYDTRADFFQPSTTFPGTAEGILFDNVTGRANCSVATINPSSGAKTVFFGFEFGLIEKHAHRALLTYYILKWLGAELGHGIRDLAVSDMSFTPANPKYMDTVTITATIQNNGECNETNVVVAFYVDGELISKYPDNKDPIQSGLFIGANGESITVSKQWLATSVGNHTIRVVVDPFNYIDELSEVNNDVTYSTLIPSSVGVGYNILVVDDDNHNSGPRDTTKNITLALDYLGYDYDLAVVPSGFDGPPLENEATIYGTKVLKRYNTVIWNTGGETNNTLKLNDTQALIDYLAGNFIEAQEFPEDIHGSLLLTGCGILNELLSPSYPDHSKAVDLIQNYLHIDPNQIEFDVGLADEIYGPYGDEITHGMDYPTMDEYNDTSDSVVPINGAVGIFKAISGYFGTDGRWVDYTPAKYNATRYHNDKYDVVFLPWDIAFIGGSGGGGTRSEGRGISALRSGDTKENRTGDTRAASGRSRAYLLGPDSFESGYGNWATSNSNEIRRITSPDMGGDYREAYSGSWSIDLRDGNGVSDYLQSSWVDITGYTNIRLDFYYHEEDLESSEHLRVRLYHDGGWQYIWNSPGSNNGDTTTTQNEYVHVNINLDTYITNPSQSIRVRFYAPSNWDNVNWDECALDYISITGDLAEPKPHLSNGGVSPGSGVRADTFTYTVTYTHDSGQWPTVIRVYIDGTPYDMTLQSGNPNTGAVYTYSTTGTALGIGTHNYYFYCVDDNGDTDRLPASGTSSGPTVNNQDPTVALISPANGAVDVPTPVTLQWSGSDPDGDTLTYTVYCDTNNPPTTSVYSGGDTSTTVSLATSTTYYWKVVANDGYGGTPSTSVWSFTTAAYVAPYLTDGYVDPYEGDTLTQFTYHVTYYNGDNNPPDSAFVYIDGVAHAMAEADPSDTSYDDGKEYIYNTTLPIGTHTFYFEFTTDGGTTTLRLPILTGATYSGPIVNEPQYVSVDGRDMENELVYMTLRWFGYVDNRVELKTSRVDISIDNPHPVLGDAYVLKSMIYNYGGSDATTTVRILDGSTIIDTQSIYVPANGKSPIETIWTPLFAGNRPITIAIDPDNSVSEVFDTLNNNGTRLDPVVYFFYDDMESGTGNWHHDATIARINGEGKLDYMEEPVNSNINDTWAQMNGFHLNTDVNNPNLAGVYHTAPHSYFMHEPKAEISYRPPLDVVFALDTSGSMSGTKINNLKAATKQFIDQLTDKDRCAIFIFNGAGWESARPLLRLPYAYMTDANKASFKNTVDTFTASGYTCFYDTVGEAVQYVIDNVIDPDPNPLLLSKSRLEFVIAMTDGASNSDDDWSPETNWGSFTHNDPQNYDQDGIHQNDIGLKGLIQAPPMIFSIGLGISHDNNYPTAPGWSRTPPSNAREYDVWHIADSSPAILHDDGGKYGENATTGEDNVGHYYYTTDPNQLPSIFNDIFTTIEDIGAQQATRGGNTVRSRATILSDDFEGVFPDGWTASGVSASTSDSNSPTHCAWFTGGGNYYLSRYVDLSGYSSATLTFYLHRDGDMEQGQDYFYLEIDDGSGWQQIRTYNVNDASSWTQFTVDLSSYNLISSFGIRFHAYSTGSNENWRLDDVVLSGTPSGGGGGGGTYNPTNPWTDGTTENSDKYLETNPLDMRNIDHATLSFYQKYNLKIGANGGVILVGTADAQGGPYTYHYVQPNNPYTGNILISEWSNRIDYSESEVHNGGVVRPPWCWNGISGGGTMDWDYVTVNLDDFVGKWVKIVFYYVFTTGGTGYGWAIDDVEVKIGRSDTNPNLFGNVDNWVLNETNQSGIYSHSGTHAWFCGDETLGGDFKAGVDNSLYTRPIDLTNARTATLSAYFKFNIQYKAGRPPDGFRVEISTDGGMRWTPLNLGVRAAWNVSGNESDGSDGVLDGKAYTGIDAGNGWVRANTLTRLETSLDGFIGHVVIIRFRVVTENADSPQRHYQDASKPKGLYIDDVIISGYSLGSSRGVDNALNEGQTPPADSHMPKEDVGCGPGALMGGLQTPTEKAPTYAEVHGASARKGVASVVHRADGEVGGKGGKDANSPVSIQALPPSLTPILLMAIVVTGLRFKNRLGW